MWQRLGRLGTITEFWRVFSELNPENIRADAERPFRLLLLGQADSGKTKLAETLANGRFPGQPEVLLEIPSAAQAFDWHALPLADLHLFVIDALVGVSPNDRLMLRELQQRRRAVVVIVNKCDLATNQQELSYNVFRALGDVPADRIAFGSAIDLAGLGDALGPMLLRAMPEHRLALPRRLPVFRRVVGDEIIVETSRVNAEFALLSNLPANIPLLGGLIGDSADFIVLTKNQAMMIFKLAAIHGRDMRSKLGLIAELAPVVGAAFVWRTLARELIGLLPSVVGAVPKTAIGYAGTYVVGKMAQYYFSEGLRPTRAMVERFTGEATQKWRGLIDRRRVDLIGEGRPTRKDQLGRPD